MPHNDAFTLKDSFGRTIDNLRVSVTDRCNFRCLYCMPEHGMAWMKKDELLTHEEIVRLAGVFVGLGVRKIRLTGGEPLMRRDLHVLVEMLSNTAGIEDLALTTNGYFLSEQAEALARAGLKRINISLDSLNPIKFREVTRRNYYDRVWEGIKTVEALGIGPIKINVVLMRGINDDEIMDFVNLARKSPLVIRFIEFMPIGKDDGWNMERVVPTQEVIETIERKTGRKLVPIEYRDSEPASRFTFDDGVGEIGFISSVSEPFCNRCNRIRLTSDGKLRTCLFSLKETDLKRLLREGAADREIKQAILEAVWNKEPGHLINRPGFVRPNRTMSQIGG